MEKQPERREYLGTSFDGLTSSETAQYLLQKAFEEAHNNFIINKLFCTHDWAYSKPSTKAKIRQAYKDHPQQMRQEELF